MHPFHPFVPDDLLGTGGMGRVLRATHATLGVPVALKVLPGAAALAFDAEVASIAALAHPGIVRLYDGGRSQAPHDDLPAGTPWLAMELADATLAERPPLDGAELLAILHTLLDALGHAHGHGRLHLDVKPSNLLRIDDRVVLADFGIATRFGGRTSGRGTRGFAPPEQLQGRWRDLGPWTDLYAVGATAARLAAPGALEPWIRRATHPIPEARFSSAAEARHHLPDQAAGARLAAPAPPTAATVVSAAANDASEPIRGTAFWPPLPLPPPADDAPGRQLGGLGAGVFGQRTVPLVGRHEERATLWSDLEATLHSRSPRVRWLEGPAGVGASRLAEWFAAEAHRVSGCRTWWAHHDAGDGLRDALLRGLGAIGLDGPQLTHRLDDILPDRKAIPWLAGHPVPATKAAEAVAAVLTALAPGVLVLDDAHQADPDLVDALLDRLSGSVMVVGTVDPGVRTFPGPRLPLGPLSDADLRDLLRGLLGLDATTAADVADRAEGNAQVAVQLIAAALTSGALRPGRGGLELAGATLPLPTGLWEQQVAQVAGDDLDALQLAAVLGPRFDPPWCGAVAAPTALAERALRAQLWQVRDGTLAWSSALAREAALRHADLPALHLRAARLFDPDLDPARAGEHLVRGGDLAKGVGLLMRGIRELHNAGSWLAADRADRLLQEALQGHPDPSLAIDRVLERVRVAEVRKKAKDAAELLDSIRAPVGERGTPAQQGLFAWLEGQVLVAEHRPAEALAAFERAEAIEVANPPRRARLFRAQARCLRQLGRLDEALAALDRGIEVAEALPADPIGADLRLTMAVTLHTAGRLDEALPRYHQAIERYGDRFPNAVGEAWSNIGELHRHRGERDLARQAYEQARPQLEAAGVTIDWLLLGTALLDMEERPAVAYRDLVQLADRAGCGAQVGFAHLFALQAAPDPDAWDRHWALGHAELPQLPAERDLAWSLARAADHAITQGWPERAQQARAAAERLQEGLGS